MKVNNGHVFVPVSFSGTLFGSDRWEGTERVQLYADEGYGVQVEYWRTSRTGTSNALFSITGHLVNFERHVRGVRPHR